MGAIVLAFLLIALPMGAQPAYADGGLEAGRADALVAQDDAGADSQVEDVQVAGANIAVVPYVQGQGWKKPVASGKTAGTTGKSLRIEGLKISKVNTSLSGSVRYRAHVQNIGWQAVSRNGQIAGAPGEGLRIEAVKIWLTGDLAKNYDVRYRTHVQNVGWTAWSKNGGSSGTTGRSLRIEAMQVKLVPKTAAAVGGTVKDPGIRYDAHVQNIGWQDWVGNGAVAGTSGRSLRVEGFNFLVNSSSCSGGVMYKSHVQNIGWQDWVRDGAMTGTSGKALRVEAIRIKLTGNLAKRYDVYYRVHAQNIGWLDWAKNGAMAGTSGCSYRLEAIQVKLVKKGAAAPGPTATPSAVGRWNALEAQYRNNSSVHEILEVKYLGGSNAWVVLRKKSGKKWATVVACQGYVGSRGIGAAREFLARTPEGNFGITEAFGINGDPGAKLPYVRVDSSMYWCSDEPWYNQLIDIYQHPHACTGEHLIDYAPHYNYGLFFDYNTNPVRYGAGSAFFVHCTGSAKYTGGCVAVSEANMIKIIRNVSRGARLCIYPN